MICGGGALLWFGHAAVTTGGAGGWGLISLGLYALMTVAGFRLAQQRSGGTVLSVLVQAMQVARISTVRLEYLFLAGCQGLQDVLRQPAGKHANLRADDIAIAAVRPYPLNQSVAAAKRGTFA